MGQSESSGGEGGLPFPQAQPVLRYLAFPAFDSTSFLLLCDTRQFVHSHLQFSFYLNKKTIGAWWLIPGITVLRRQRQESSHKIKVVH